MGVRLAVTTNPVLAGFAPGVTSTLRVVTWPGIRLAGSADPSPVGLVDGTTHGSPLVVCAPRPTNVSVAKPSHSAAGSKTFEPLASPPETQGFRASVLSAVLMGSLPHWTPGSNPTWPMTSTASPPFTSAMASSPLNHDAVLVWFACGRTDVLALACASTNTSLAATVPERLTVVPAVAAPLKYIR